MNNNHRNHQILYCYHSNHRSSRSQSFTKATFSLKVYTIATLLLCFVFLIVAPETSSFVAVTPPSSSTTTTQLLMTTTTTSIRPYALNVEVHLLPERRDEFLSIIIKDAQQTMQTEPGAIQFTIGVDTTNNDKFHFHEEYQTKNYFDFHTTTPHFKEWNDFCSTQPFVSDPIVQFYQCRNERVPPSQSPTTVPVYCLNVELCIRDNVREEFLSVIDKNQSGSRSKEPLCIQYEYGESPTTPNHFYFHEQYTGNNNGKEGFEQHSQSDHFKKWEEFAATNPFTQDPVVRFFQSIPY